jgi:hypothetical protein
VCARTRIAALALSVVACVPSAPERFVTHPPALAQLRLRLPSGATAAYDVVLDRWVVATAIAHASLAIAPPGSVASPDAFRHAREVELRGAKVEIHSRESLSDGFATTLVEHAAADQPAPAHSTYVVRQLGNQWVQCVGAVSLCKSLKRG